MKKRIKRSRDAQRARVYKADEVLHGMSRANVSTVPAIEAYVAKVWAAPRVREAFPKATGTPPPVVMDGRGRRSAGGNGRMITMPKWSRRESIVLHELAHTITDRTYGREVAGHGWQYCSVYLRLVQEVMGWDAWCALRHAFRQRKVQYVDPATVVTRPRRRAAEAAGEPALAARPKTWVDAWNAIVDRP